jgi:hypothetical protein
MEYEEALIIGKRRRGEAALTLSIHLRERAVEVCAVKPAWQAGLDARDWEPVGEENFKEICLRTGSTGDREAYLLVVDGDGTAKACSPHTYPLLIAMQMACGIPLAVYAGRDGTLLAELAEEEMRKAQNVAQLPDL